MSKSAVTKDSFLRFLSKAWLPLLGIAFTYAYALAWLIAFTVGFYRLVSIHATLPAYVLAIPQPIAVTFGIFLVTALFSVTWVLLLNHAQRIWYAQVLDHWYREADPYPALHAC